MNNPTSAFDPSGRDYIFVGGHGQKEGSTNWHNEMVKALGVDVSKERVIFIEDKYTGFGQYEAQDQYSELVKTLFQE